MKIVSPLPLQSWIQKTVHLPMLISHQTTYKGMKKSTPNKHHHPQIQIHILWSLNKEKKHFRIITFNLYFVIES